MLSTLESVCIPAASGGNLAELAKAAGYKKAGENFQMKRPTYSMIMLAPGSNPNQCHVDVIHPVDLTEAGKPIALALHNWAAVIRDWEPFRNDKNVAGDQELTTRSWEHAADGKNEALVFTTFRKKDGTPSQRNADTSTMLYSITKTQ